MHKSVFRLLTVVSLIVAAVLLSVPLSMVSAANNVKVSKPKHYTITLRTPPGQNQPPIGVTNQLQFGFEQPTLPDMNIAPTNTSYWAGLPNDPSLPLFSRFAACGFTAQPDVQPIAVLTLPDKSTQNITLTNANGGCWKYEMDYVEGMQLGTYSVKITDTANNANTLAYSWNVDYPKFKMISPMENGSQVFVMGFKPGENITLYFYAVNKKNGVIDVDPVTNKANTTFVEADTRQADDFGAALLSLKIAPSAGFNLEDVKFLVDGIDNADMFKVMSGAVTCPGSPTQRLAVNFQARVLANVATQEDYTALHIAAKNGTVMGHVPAGDTVNVIYGPVCAPQFSWWKVQHGTDIGWMIEGKNKTYWLEPVQQ